MKNFDDLIKETRAEIEALKSVKRKSSLTLATITKTATGTAVIYKQGATRKLHKAALITIKPKDADNQLIIGHSQPARAVRGRNITIQPWTTPNGDLGLLASPGTTPDTFADGYNNVTVTINITATGDFTTESSQILVEAI